MTAIIPAAVEVGGITYGILDRLDVEDGLPYSWRPYVEKIEQSVIQQAELSGSSRPAKSTRPDVLSWRLDDWSGGEGQQFLDSSDDLNFQKYWYSDAVDVRTKGQLTLGLLFSQASTLGGTSRFQGPYLVHRGGGVVGTREEAYVDDRVYSNTTGAPDTWTDRAQAARTAGNRISGPARVHGGYVWAAYKDGTGGANSSDVRRIDASFVSAQAVVQGSSAIQGSNSENALIANNRLFFMKDSGGQLVLNRSTSVLSTLPLTIATAYTVANVGAEVGIDNIANRVYVISEYDSNEEPRVHLYIDGTLGSGAERARLPIGFRMDGTPFDAAVFLGDILFCGGKREGATGVPDQGMLVYVSGGRVGTVGIIRDGLVANRIMCLSTGFRNQLLIAAANTDGTAGQLGMVYDIQNGGLSQLFTGIPVNEIPISIDYYAGVYYAGVRTTLSGTSGGVKIYRTQVSGNNKYPASSTLRSSIWDFNYPEADKLIESVEIATAPLPVGTTVQLQLVLDENTTITTTKTGGALTHSGTGATKTKFYISGLDGSSNGVARTCRSLRVNVILNSPANQDLTPTVYSVTVKALPRQYTHFFEMVLSLEDDAPGQWGTSYPKNGEEKARNLRTLRDTDPIVPTSLKIHYRSGNLTQIPSTSVPTLEVILEDCELVLMKRSNGYARCLFRRVDV